MQANSVEDRPFSIEVPEAELTEVRMRINTTRWPERETVIRLTVIVNAISSLIALYILGFDNLFTFVVNKGVLSQPLGSPTPAP